MARRPVLVLSPVRNEAPLLARVLPTWEQYADHIVVADQGSTDGTCERLRQSLKTTVVSNDSEEYDEIERQRLLVETARRICPNGILLFLDADETLSANVLRAPEWRSFQDSPPGTLGRFRWVQLWTSPFRYISSGMMADGLYDLAFVDDGRPFRGDRVIHGRRGVGWDDPARVFLFNEVVCLHFAWVFHDRAVRRQNFYKAWYVVRGARSYHVNNRNHSWYRRVEPRHLDETPGAWLDAYRATGMDLTSSECEDLLWYDVEVLRWFARYGERRFHLLDIWQDVDWEVLRLKAAGRGLKDLPDRPIRKPPRWLVRFNALSAGRLSVRSWPAKGWRGLLRLLLP